MIRRVFSLVVCLSLLATACWLGNAGQDKVKSDWKEIAPGVLRSSGPVAGYALVSGERALLIDAPAGDAPANGATIEAPSKSVDGVLLTHYHRAVCDWLTLGVRQKPLGDGDIQAPKGAEEWLGPEQVKKYWKISLPLRGSRTAYQVVPVGIDGISYTLTDGKTISWEGWNLRIIDTPGHALAHVAIVAQKAGGPRLLFCGGALAASGKLWAPYTTDWDHWTDLGLKTAAGSLAKLIDVKADILCPTYGPVVTKNVDAAIKQTLKAVEEVGYLKSFERFTKERLGNAPEYRFLAKEQATSNGSKPWSRVSDHLWLTGNTYVLTSKDGLSLMIDPWDKRSAVQFAKLQKEKGVGPLEVVMFSHAHFDHYDGIYHLPDRDKFQVWSLDLVAQPIAAPFQLRAPFLDARPVKFDRTPKDGETLTWREYRFRFHHLPGQSEFTMGVETEIDGKRCYFTADNFFHQDMFSGSGGWMGLNRSFPPSYAASARKVLDAGPEWVMAEHGGPFEFSAEDFRRRVQWGEACAKAADALCLSSNHLADWNPHRIHVEPLVQKAKRGSMVQATLVVTNLRKRPEKLKVSLEGRREVRDESWELDVPPGTLRLPITLRFTPMSGEERYVFPLHCVSDGQLDASDAFVVIDLDN